MIENYTKKIKKIFFIGIGGIGMSGIARILKTIGYAVCGSDIRESSAVKELRDQDIPVFIGHKASHLNDAAVVVTSSAISPANPEFLAAREKKLPVLTRGEMLAELMRLKYGIAVAGTHGKTTTTAMVTAVLTHGGLSPTSIIGGKWTGFNSNARLGKSHYLICEADESDGSFLNLNPAVSIVTNIDLDHMDYYKTKQNLLTHFEKFINKTPFYGKAVLCGDDPHIQEILSEIKRPVLTYGFSDNTELQAINITFENEKMRFQVFMSGKDLGVFHLNLPGRHNVLNALAAIGVGVELGLDIPSIKKSLSEFKGVVHRMTTLGTWQGFTVIDDYGHHPTELTATINALRETTERLIVIFQPHRFSRTLLLFEEFAQALSGKNDDVFIDEIYPAGETTDQEITSELISARVKNKSVCRPGNRKILKKLLKEKTAGKKGIILTIGAGDIYKLGKELVSES